MRTLVDLADPQVHSLDALARRDGKSRAALIRRAIDEFLERRRTDKDTAFGAWGDQAEDGLAYQQRVRDEW